MSNVNDTSLTWRHLITGAAVAALFTASLSLPAAAQIRQLRKQRPISNPQRPSAPTLKIVSPVNGAVISGESVQLSIQVGTGMDLEKLKISLNGKQLDSRRRPSSCSDNLCTVDLTLSNVDSLRDGNNRLRADIAGNDGQRLDTRIADFQFDESGKLGSSGQATTYTPLSLGLSTIENGGNGKPWITITTGQQAGVDDPLDGYPALRGPDGSTFVPSLPGADVSFTTDCSGSTYQAVVLDRTDPTVVELTSCINYLADMKSDFQSEMGRSLNANDLIIFGTTPGNFARPGLDTSSIGGTNWTQAAKTNPGEYPTYYIIAGVMGADPGTAHENFLPEPQQDIPYTWAAFLRGSMVKDSSGHYNYIPGLEEPFQAISGSKPTITIGSTTYTPPANSVNGFWLMVVDPVYLQPINTYSTYPVPYEVSANCGWGAGSTQCGYFFPMGNNDTGGAQALATAIGQVSPDNLIFIVSAGCPFNYTTGLSLPVVAPVLQQLGGMLHSVSYMNGASNGCNYTLVSKRDNKHSTFGTHAALSWNYFSSQQQKGAIHGNLAKDNHGFYDIAGQDQMVSDGNNGFIPSVNYTFENLASQVRDDWSFTDTPGHLAAYHDISLQVLTDPQVSKYGAHDFDVRWFYTDISGVPSSLNDIVDDRLASTALHKVTKSSWDIATDEEFAAVTYQLSVEITQASKLHDYLTGNDGNAGVRGALNGQSASILADAIATANDIGLDSTLSQITSTDFSAAASDWMNLAAGVLSTASAVVGPEGPAMLGILSGALWTGSAAGNPASLTTSTEQNPQVISGPATTYDTTLANLTTNASQYTVNLLNGFDASVDAILSDGGKVAVAGNLVETTGTGWSFISSTSYDTSFSAGAKTSLWLGVLNKLYGIRVATNVTANDPNHLGSIVNSRCRSEYVNVPADTWTISPNANDPSRSDINILAEGPAWVQPADGGLHNDAPVSQNLADMLTTNQMIMWSGSRNEQGINIAPMELIGNGPLTNSAYAQLGDSACSNPGGPFGATDGKTASKH